MSELESESSKNSKSLDEAKIDELNKSQGSTYIHLFHRMCTIIGYVVVLVLILAVYMKALSLINFISLEKYPNGLPKIDVWAMAYVFAFFFLFWGLIAFIINVNLLLVIGKGLNGVAPSFKMHYIKYTILAAISMGLVFFIFTYAVTQGLDQSVGDNVQIIFALIVVAIFVFFDYLFIEKKMEPFQNENANLEVKTQHIEIKKTCNLNLYIF